MAMTMLTLIRSLGSEPAAVATASTMAMAVDPYHEPPLYSIVLTKITTQTSNATPGFVHMASEATADFADATPIWQENKPIPYSRLQISFFVYQVVESGDPDVFGSS